jgi:hypothetical protein
MFLMFSGLCCRTVLRSVYDLMCIILRTGRNRVVLPVVSVLVLPGTRVVIPFTNKETAKKNDEHRAHHIIPHHSNEANIK